LPSVRDTAGVTRRRRCGGVLKDVGSRWLRGKVWFKTEKGRISF